MVLATASNCPLISYFTCLIVAIAKLNPTSNAHTSLRRSLFYWRIFLSFLHIALFWSRRDWIATNKILLTWACTIIVARFQSRLTACFLLSGSNPKKNHLFSRLTIWGWLRLLGFGISYWHSLITETSPLRYSSTFTTKSKSHRSISLFQSLTP